MRMIGNADPGIQNQDPGGLNLARPLVVGTLSALALVGVEPGISFTDTEALAAGPGVECNLKAGTYNTILCSRTPRGGEQYCARAVTIQEPEGLKGTLVDNKTGYRVSFGEPGVTGCSPAGTRKISFSEELRKGPAGAFEPNGPVITIQGNKPLDVRKTLNAPVDCGTPTMAGSTVRPEVTVTWVPAKGWPKLPKSVASATFNGKAQPAC